MRIEKKRLFILNVLLVAAIGIFSFFILHTETVTVNISINHQSKELDDLIKRHFPDLPEKKLTLLFVFNRLPSKTKVEDIGKLYSRFKEKVNIAVLFNEAFKLEQQINFPHVFPGNTQIALRMENRVKTPERFFVILKENKVNYLDFGGKILDQALLIQKRLNPQRDYRDYAVSIKELKQKVVERIQRGSLNLLRLTGEHGEKVLDLNLFSRVYFVHTACSSCQLKALLNNVKLKKILDGDKSVVIFSVLSSSFQLSQILEESPVNIPLYLDINDEFGMFSIITDDRKNPVEIDLPGSGSTGAGTP